MTEHLEIRPYSSAADYEGMIAYFLDAEPSFLREMGVDPALLPTREDWRASARADLGRPDAEKERFYVAWLRDGSAVGHSSISDIEPGRSAHAHLHLWQTSLRGRGLGPAFLGRSIDLYFERFDLQRIVSEPFAENRAPQRALRRLGFRLERRYRTVPSSIAFEQEVARHVLERASWRPGTYDYR